MVYQLLISCAAFEENENLANLLGAASIIGRVNLSAEKALNLSSGNKLNL